jgi:hypothetical protein
MKGANCCTKGCLHDAAHFFFRAAVCVRNKRKPAFQSGSKIGGFARDLSSPADSRPGHGFRSSAEACTRPPSRVTGIPDFAHRSAADIGRPVANRFHIVASKPVSHPLTK